MVSPRFHGIAVVLTLAPVLIAGTIPGRYIVELETEPVVEHVARQATRSRLGGSEAASHRLRVRAEQQSVRQQLEAHQATVRDSVETVANALFVEMSGADAARQLAALPGVKRVTPVRQVYMNLDRAAVLHKVAEAWSRIGDDKAGAGIKVAIIDSGIQSSHDAFKDTSLTVPEGFPRYNRASDIAYTNSKVIVARSYVQMLDFDPDISAMDHVGHGTALAMAAAGVRSAGPLATISGMAPKAFLGSYKVFGTPGYNDSSSDDVILKAIDDAVADGMDIINLSLGYDIAPRLADDPDVDAIERASKAGVIFTVSAGNNGPDLNTICSPATAPSAIAVGASANDRTFAASVEVPSLGTFVAIPGTGISPSVPVTATLKDVSTLDSDGLGCSAFPADSLKGSVALIRRGTCYFEDKLNNASKAGAVAAIIYAAESSPSPITMSVGTATLPAEMISYQDGAALKQALSSQPNLAVTLRFTLGSISIVAGRLTDFSAAGPNVDLSIKPDLLAVGENVYTATETGDMEGDMYDSTGFILVDGTSFSSPIVAGAAALLKAARPGLTVDQYRSLLINTATAVKGYAGGTDSTVQQSGAGQLDVDAALRSTVAAYPTALTFGSSSGELSLTKTLTLTNLGDATETFAIDVSTSAAAKPSPATTTIELASKASVDIPVAWTATGLSAGAYEGFITITGSTSGTQARVPYWHAVSSGMPATITTLDALTSARRGSTERDAVLFRITDAPGLALTSVTPQVTVVSGGGSVLGVVNYDTDAPGLFGIDVKLGPTAGTNVFRIQAGDIVKEYSITGQ